MNTQSKYPSTLKQLSVVDGITLSSPVRRNSRPNRV